MIKQQNYPSVPYQPINIYQKYPNKGLEELIRERVYRTLGTSIIYNTNIFHDKWNILSLDVK